eukprot:10021857-Lingulodinium_polyedra.AAC.1
MRLPLPRPAVGAIAGVIINESQPEMALFVLLAFSTYLRPSECWNLTARALAPPVSCDLPHWGLVVNDAYLG